MSLWLTVFAQTSRSLSLLGVSEEGRERGGRGRKKMNQTKKAAPMAARGCAQTLLLLIFSSFFFFLGSCKDVWVWVLIRSKTMEALSQEIADCKKCSISLSWGAPKHPSKTVSAPAASLPSSSVTSGLALFWSTSAWATFAFFSPLFLFSFCSVPVLTPSCLNPCRLLPTLSLPKLDSPLLPSQFLFTRVPGITFDFHIPLSWFPCPLVRSPFYRPFLPSHPFITGPCSVNPRGFCLFVLELLLQLATDPTYFLTSHLNSRAALQLLHQLTYH